MTSFEKDYFSLLADEIEKSGSELEELVTRFSQMSGKISEALAPKPQPKEREQEKKQEKEKKETEMIPDEKKKVVEFNEPLFIEKEDVANESVAIVTTSTETHTVANPTVQKISEVGALQYKDYYAVTQGRRDSHQISRWFGMEGPIKMSSVGADVMRTDETVQVMVKFIDAGVDFDKKGVENAISDFWNWAVFGNDKIHFMLSLGILVIYVPPIPKSSPAAPAIPKGVALVSYRKEEGKMPLIIAICMKETSLIGWGPTTLTYPEQVLEDLVTALKVVEYPKIKELSPPEVMPYWRQIMDV